MRKVESENSTHTQQTPQHSSRAVVSNSIGVWIVQRVGSYLTLLCHELLNGTSQFIRSGKVGTIALLVHHHGWIAIACGCCLLFVLV